MMKAWQELRIDTPSKGSLWRQCIKKRRYSHEHAALREVTKASDRQPHKRFHAYSCRFCEGWHISGN